MTIFQRIREDTIEGLTNDIEIINRARKIVEMRHFDGNYQTSEIAEQVRILAEETYNTALHNLKNIALIIVGSSAVLAGEIALFYYLSR